MEGQLIIISAAIIGGAIGTIMNRLPLQAVVRSLSALVLGWLLASLLIAAFLLLRAVESAGIGAAAIGLTESLITLVPVLIVGGVLYAVLGWLGARLFPALIAYRAVLMGILGGAAAGVIAVGR